MMKKVLVSTLIVFTVGYGKERIDTSLLQDAYEKASKSEILSKEAIRSSVEVKEYLKQLASEIERLTEQMEKMKGEVERLREAKKEEEAVRVVAKEIKEIPFIKPVKVTVKTGAKFYDEVDKEEVLIAGKDMKGEAISVYGDYYRVNIQGEVFFVHKEFVLIDGGKK